MSEMSQNACGNVLGIAHYVGLIRKPRWAPTHQKPDGNLGKSLVHHQRVAREYGGVGAGAAPSRVISPTRRVMTMPPVAGAIGESAGALSRRGLHGHSVLRRAYWPGVVDLPQNEERAVLRDFDIDRGVA